MTSAESQQSFGQLQPAVTVASQTPFVMFSLLIKMLYGLAALATLAAIACLCAITADPLLPILALIMISIAIFMLVYGNGLRKHRERLYKKFRRSAIVLILTLAISLYYVPILPMAIRSAATQSLAWSIGLGLSGLVILLLGIVWIYGLIVLAKKQVKELFGIWS